MKLYKHGKDQEHTPCIEFDDGTVMTLADFQIMLFKKLEEKAIVTQAEIKPVTVAMPSK